MERLRIIFRFWPMALCAVFYIYLAVHAFTGRQGLLRWIDYERETNSLQIKLDRLVAEREALEQRESYMAGPHLDVDWLDYKLRENLFYSHPKEVTIWLD